MSSKLMVEVEKALAYVPLCASCDERAEIIVVSVGRGGKQYEAVCKSCGCLHPERERDCDACPARGVSCWLLGDQASREERFEDAPSVLNIYPRRRGYRCSECGYEWVETLSTQSADMELDMDPADLLCDSCSAHEMWAVTADWYR
jgi:hypothetical protein